MSAARTSLVEASCPATKRAVVQASSTCFWASETKREEEFVVESNVLFVSLDQIVPGHLAGPLDFREFRFKGVAHEMSVGIKSKFNGRSV